MYESTIFVTNPIGKGNFKLISKTGWSEKESYEKVINAFESLEYWIYPNTHWITAKDITSIMTKEITI